MGVELNYYYGGSYAYFKLSNVIEYADIEELYRICEYAREICMKEEWLVGRVIARPYVGSKKGEFKRTTNRKDYAVKPPTITIMDKLKSSNYDVIYSTLD